MTEIEMVDIEACVDGGPASDSGSNTMTTATATVSGSISTAADSDKATAAAAEDEKPVRLTSAGYKELANLMAAYPASAVFRRFASLYVGRVLYLQAQIVAHEGLLKHYAEQDYDSPDSHRQRYCRDYWLMKHGLTDHGATGTENDQHRTWTELGVMLKEYSEALQIARTVLGFDEPNKHDLEFLKRWKLYKGHVVLTGVDHDIWDKTPESDLLVLQEHRYDDHISQWISLSVVPWFGRVLGTRVKKIEPAESPFAGTLLYKGKYMRGAVSAIAISFASLLPILAIVVLHFNLGDKLKLGFMAVFTVVFSLALAWFSGAKKTEIFAASAAFAAVQVVFVSGDASRCKT